MQWMFCVQYPDNLYQCIFLPKNTHLQYIEQEDCRDVYLPPSIPMVRIQEIEMKSIV